MKGLGVAGGLPHLNRGYRASDQAVGEPGGSRRPGGMLLRSKSMLRAGGSRGAALVISIVGGMAGVAGVVAGIVYLRVRPACPPGYVRLLDVSQAIPWVCGFLTLAAGSCVVSSLPPGRRRVVAVTAAAVAVVAIGLLVVTIISLVRVGNIGTCWAS